MTATTSAYYATRSEQETFMLGQALGQAVRPGDVLALAGDLGAGKTVLVKGLAAGLGIDPAAVQSPTFTLLNTYAGRLTLYHFDLYRLEDPSEPEQLGFTEILEAGEGVAAVEWGNKFAQLLPDTTVWVTLTKSAACPDERDICFTGEPHGLLARLEALAPAAAWGAPGGDRR